jgi:hypothetical protein
VRIWSIWRQLPPLGAGSWIGANGLNFVWQTYLATFLHYSSLLRVGAHAVFSTYHSLYNGLLKERDHMQSELNPVHTFTSGYFTFLFNIILPKSKDLRSSPYSLVYDFLLPLTLRNTFLLFCSGSVATFTPTDTIQASRCLATRRHCAVAACVALPAKTNYNKRYIF